MYKVWSVSLLTNSWHKWNNYISNVPFGCDTLLQWCYSGVTVVLQWCYTAGPERLLLLVQKPSPGPPVTERSMEREEVALLSSPTQFTKNLYVKMYIMILYILSPT